MATLAQKAAIAAEAAFQTQVKMQISIEAVAQLNAIRTGTSSSNDKRISLAKSILLNSDAYVMPFCNGIAANIVVSDPPTDAQVATAVTAAFPFIAGIIQGE